MNHTTASASAPYYFISYSRQETPFVDSLSRELDKRAIKNWVDFRSLVPGRAWQPQLDEAVNASFANRSLLNSPPLLVKVCVLRTPKARD